MSSPVTVVPVILAGGGGTRLWPLSRGHYPKQFLSVAGEGSLLQQTLARLGNWDGINLRETIVVCNEEHRFLVAEQARLVDHPLQHLILEPVGRNTAPALTAAAFAIEESDQDAIMVMMPADHLIPDIAAFSSSLSAAVAAAAAGDVVTMGVTPTRAETGYGYIEAGERKGDSTPSVRKLVAFHEKPDLATAEKYLGQGGFSWNSGIYIMRTSTWLKLAQEHCPGIYQSAQGAVRNAQRDGDFLRLDAAAFSASPSDSIDYAVMEPVAKAGGQASVVSLDAGWSDVGSWSSLWNVSDKDDQGNVVRGDVVNLDSTNNLVVAEHRLVATLGCKNLSIVETADAVLVADQSCTEEVKRVVEWLSEQRRDEQLTHKQVYRPWGSYTGIDEGNRFQVKRITVNPGAALSLQMHHHRAEHWIVVSGTARVTRGEETFLISENESTYIPIGEKHRLENPGNLPLELIEVQSGAYLGEDDIVRFEDDYKRV